MTSMDWGFLPTFPDLTVAVTDSLCWFYSQRTYCSYNLNQLTSAKLRGWVLDLQEHCQQTDAYSEAQLQNYLAECYKCSRYAVAYYTHSHWDSSNCLPSMSGLHWQAFSEVTPTAILPFWLPVHLRAGTQPLEGSCGLALNARLLQVLVLVLLRPAVALSSELQQAIFRQLQQKFPNLQFKLLVLTPHSTTPLLPIDCSPIVEVVQQMLTTNFGYNLWHLQYSSNLPLSEILQAMAGKQLRQDPRGLLEWLQSRYLQPIQLTVADQHLILQTIATASLDDCYLWLA